MTEEVRIPLSVIKKHRKVWSPTKHTELFSSQDAIKDRNAFRIYIPLLPIDKTEIATPWNIIEFLKAKGYEVEDYVKGLAKQINGKRVMRIGVLLKDNESMSKQFTNDPVRNSGKAGDLLVCISRHPLDIIRMSTGRGWSSCMDILDGCNKNYVLEDVRYGSLIAYLINKNDKAIKNPLGRVLIKSFVSEKNDVEILYPETQTYGTVSKNFQRTVTAWVDRINENKAGLFRLRRELYNDGRKYVVNAFDKLSEDEQIKMLREAEDVNSFGTIFKAIKNHPHDLAVLALTKDVSLFQHIIDPDTRVKWMALRISSPQIKYIKNPSPAMLRYAVKTDGFNIQHVEQTEELNMLAVKSFPHALSCIKKPSFNVKRRAIAMSGDAIRHIPRNECTPYLKKLALKSNGMAISCIDNPTDEMKWAAVKTTPAAITYVDNAPYEMQLAAVKAEGRVINHLRRAGYNITDELKLAAIEQDYSLLYYMNDNDITDEMKRVAIRKSWKALGYVWNLHENDIVFAVKEHGTKALPCIPRAEKYSAEKYTALAEQVDKNKQAAKRAEYQKEKKRRDEMKALKLSRRRYAYMVRKRSAI